MKGKKTNCRPLRVSTFARNFLRFLLAFTILNSIAAPSNGMLPMKGNKEKKMKTVLSPIFFADFVNLGDTFYDIKSKRIKFNEEF